MNFAIDDPLGIGFLDDTEIENLLVNFRNENKFIEITKSREFRADSLDFFGFPPAFLFCITFIAIFSALEVFECEQMEPEWNYIKLYLILLSGLILSGI